MTKHKEALIRYRIIDQCLRNRKTVSIDELIEACYEKDIRVSERTIREDIKNMKYDLSLGYEAPIENIRPKKYKYTDPYFSINKLPLSDYELESLGFASKLLEQFNNMAPFDQIQGAVQKIFNHLKIRNSLSEQEFSEMIDFEKAPITSGLKYIEPILNAIRRKKVIKIEHRYFGAEKCYSRIIHPYLLKEYRDRWYLLGYNEDVDDLRVFGLDRIENVEIEYAKKYIESKSRPKDYFKNLIGVTKLSGTKPENIVLKFSSRQAPYVLSQPLHESQKVLEQTEDYTIVSVKVHYSTEIEIILLGWNKEVEVLKPVEIRNRVKNLSQELSEIYQSQ